MRVLTSAAGHWSLLVRDSSRSTLHSMPPVVLTIAGSDCSAGAGAQADLKTITALGGYGLTALTSVVSETPARVSRIQLLDAEMVSDQICVLAEAFPIAAVKTGMLGGAVQIEAVVGAWESFEGRNVPLVVDPVMVATSGGRLLDEGSVGRRLLKLGIREGGQQQEQDGQWAAVHRETPDVG